MPDLSEYPNILFLSVSFNEITGDISNSNLVELSCHNNKIKSIKSKKLERLNKWLK
jgi:Leucine-rich repeat (LRR) protein